MPEKRMYEYALIRLVPRVDLDEFVNIGLLLFSKRSQFIRIAYDLNRKGIDAYSETIDLDYLARALQTFEWITYGHPKGGPISALDVPERFRWLTSVKSAAIQMSAIHPGMSTDLDETFEHIYRQYFDALPAPPSI